LMPSGRRGAGGDILSAAGAGRKRASRARVMNGGRIVAMEYVQTDAGLEAIAHDVAGVPLLAVDTEAAGYHRYQDRICLVQLSTRTDTYLIDTLAVSGLTALAPVLANPETEIVLHDADYDLRLLRRD